jgi:hypothetical protein
MTSWDLQQVIKMAPTRTFASQRPGCLASWPASRKSPDATNESCGGGPRSWTPMPMLTIGNGRTG